MMELSFNLIFYRQGRRPGSVEKLLCVFDSVFEPYGTPQFAYNKRRGITVCRSGLSRTRQIMFLMHSRELCEFAFLFFVKALAKKSWRNRYFENRRTISGSVAFPHVHRLYSHVQTAIKTKHSPHHGFHTAEILTEDWQLWRQTQMNNYTIPLWGLVFCSIFPPTPALLHQRSYLDLCLAETTRRAGSAHRSCVILLNHYKCTPVWWPRWPLSRGQLVSSLTSSSHCLPSFHCCSF